MKAVSSLRAGQHRLQIDTNNIVGEDARIGEGPGHTHSRSVRIIEELLPVIRKRALTGGLDHGEYRFRRPAVMNVTVGQRETAQSMRIVGSENLRDRPAAVVTYEIDLINAEGIDKLQQHLRLSRKRDILCRADFGVAKSHQIQCDAAAYVGNPGNHVSPMKTVERNTVHEEGNRTLAILNIGDAPLWQLDELSATVKRAHIHVCSPTVPGHSS